MMQFDKKKMVLPSNYGQKEMRKIYPLLSYDFHDEEELIGIEWTMPRLDFLRMQVLVFNEKEDIWAEIVSIDYALDLNYYYGLDWTKNNIIHTRGGLSNPFVVRTLECLDMSSEAWFFPIVATGI